jgi:hypothetical protein
MSKTAMATLCLGECYIQSWRQYSRAGWERYAHRHGYEIVVFSDPLDNSPRAQARSPAWQKCCVLDKLKNYDRVIWIDSDIVIHPAAPAITERIPEGKVGAVISGSYIHPDLRSVFLERVGRIPVGHCDAAEAWRCDQADFYRRAGVKCNSTDVVNSGVMVLDQSHRGIFRRVYEADYPADLVCYEQFPLSAEILNSNLLHRLSSRFNFMFRENAAVHYPYLFDESLPERDFLARLAVKTALSNSYFLHFARALEYMRFLP